MHYTCRYSTVFEIAVKSRDQMKGSAATVKFNHACLSPPFLLSLPCLLFHKSHCRSSLVNGDLEQLPLNCQSPGVAYMMSVEGKVKVTSSAVMKTHTAGVQSRVFYNSVAEEEDSTSCHSLWNHAGCAHEPRCGGRLVPLALDVT